MDQPVDHAKQNECVRNAAALASGNDAWVEYVAYCTERERGLRDVAFQHLGQFLGSASTWTFTQRKEYVHWLCLRLVEFGDMDGRGLIPHPLVEQLVIPTLNEWVVAEPADPTPCRWLGLFFAGVSHDCARSFISQSTPEACHQLHAALKRDPNDQLARIRIIEMMIGDAEFACHHLPYNYLGDPADDATLLGKATDHLPYIRNPNEKARLQSGIEDVSQLIEDWVAFSTSGEADFNQWCNDRGRKHRWVKSYYF